MTNRELAQEISARIGNSPIPFDSVYSIALQIYNELGGEETQFDSVYSILLEILPLVEGGGSGKAIEEVSELPEASENKDKLFRLDNGEKDVYVSKLNTSETYKTNKLPDEQQIDMAFANYLDGVPFYYKGKWTIVCNNGVFKGFGWIQESEDSYVLLLTNEDAVNATLNTLQLNFSSYDGELDFDAHTYTIDDYVENYSWDFAQTLSEYGIEFIVAAIYNAPESIQIGNAYLIDSANDSKGVYDGTQVTFIDTDGDVEEVSGYKWAIEGETNYIATSKPASEICFDKYEYEDGGETFFRYVSNTKVWYVYPEEENSSEQSDISQNKDLEEVPIYIPQLNAPDSEQVDEAYYAIGEEDENMRQYIYLGEQEINCTDGDYMTHIWCNGDDLTDLDFIRFTKYGASSAYSAKEMVATPGDEFWDIIYYDGGWCTDDYTVAEISQMMDENEEQWWYPSPTMCELNTVKYQRDEEKWIWETVLTSDDWDDLYDELSDELLLKADKNDAVISVDIQTQTFNWGDLNDFSTTGTYRVIAQAEFQGQTYDMAVGNMFVINSAGSIAQSIVLPTPLEIIFHTRIYEQNAWTEEALNIPIIVDSTATNVTTYSSTKIESLIHALDVRLNALEGNTTVE